MGFIAGNQFNVFLLRRFKSQHLFAVALATQAVSGVVFLAVTLGHMVGLSGTLALLFVFLSCIGLTYPNSAALALAPFSREAGRASAMLGFLQTGSGALISMGIGLLGGASIAPILACTALVALAILGICRMQLKHLVENHDPDAVVLH
jgi:DHA1 family bicyclomycin/chloramphenicol resistance-like MFS transporter